MEAGLKSAQNEAHKRDMVHEALPTVPHDTAPAGHPTKGALHDPAFWQELEASLLVGSAPDYGNEVLVVGGLGKAYPVNRLKQILHALAQPASTA
jgi:hypothetical protein